MKQSHIVEKCEGGDPLCFLKLQFLAKYQKNEDDPSETFINFRKKVCAEKKICKLALSLVRFCKCTKQFAAEAGTRTRDRWVPVEPITFCTKKWHIRGELCGLTKKLATVRVVHVC